MPSLIAERLLGAGYLPKELPIEFSSTDLAGVHATLPAAALSDKKWTRLQRFSLARRGHARRLLGIPNPRYFVRLAMEIQKGWPALRRVSSSSRISISKPLFQPPNHESRHRATNLSAVQDLSEKRLWYAASNQFVLQTDIAQFFASVYTHSICWALHSKKRCKNTKLRSGLLGDALDNLVRSAQDGQTLGIPVGPDTSHILSELIASAIDVEAFGDDFPEGYRYVDDYFLCFKSRTEASQALDNLSKAATNFGLELNYAKTSIKSVGELTEAVGLDELRDFDFGITDFRKGLHKFFALAERLNDEQENSLKYAIRLLSDRDIRDVDWPVFESYLLRSITLSPNTIEYVAYTLYRHARKGAPLNTKRISKFLASTILSALTYGQDSEIVWALWIFKVLAMKVPREAAVALPNSGNSAVALLTLDLNQLGLITGTLDITRWRRVATLEELDGESWLLAYEALHQRWLKPRAAAAILGSHPFFSEIHQRGVSFYHRDRLTVVESLWANASQAADSTDLGPIKWFLPNRPQGFTDLGMDWFY